MRHELEKSDALLRFMLAGNARLTLQSLKTGQHYTYRIMKTKINKPFYFVRFHMPTFEKYIGSIWLNGEELSFKQQDQSRYADAFAYFITVINQKLDAPNLKVFHEGRCGRCGRPLTNPESIQTGLGPDCAGR